MGDFVTMRWEEAADRRAELLGGHATPMPAVSRATAPAVIQATARLATRAERTRRPSAVPARMGRSWRSVSYQAFVPDSIAELQLLVSFEASAAIAEADEAVRALDRQLAGSGPSSLRGALIRTEAAASSRLAGDDVSHLDLATAQRERGDASAAARRVVANVRAIEAALEIRAARTIEAALEIGSARTDGALTLADIERIHCLVTAADEAAADGAPVHGGRVRTEQTWIGGDGRDPVGATYVPPPPEALPELLDDLVRFINRADIPAVAQAAIAHAQFAAIRPFRDGNGRTGRALVQLILARRGLTPNSIVPVSIALAARPTTYLVGLTGFRDGEVLDWCLTFADAVTRIARTSAALATRVAALQVEWHSRAGNPRTGSAAARIIDQLPSQPVLSAGSIRTVIGSSHQRAADGLARLAETGVLRQLGDHAYDRTYVADELFALDEIFKLDELADLVDICVRLADETAFSEGPGSRPEYQEGE